MEIIAYITVGIAVGFLIGWLIGKAKAGVHIQTEKDIAQQKFNELDKELVAHKATSNSQLQAASKTLSEKENEVIALRQDIKELSINKMLLNNQLGTANADLRASIQSIEDKNKDIDLLREELKTLKLDFAQNNLLLATTKASHDALIEKLQIQKQEMEEMGKKFNIEFENIANKIFETKSEKFTELNNANLKNILEPLGKNISDFKSKVEEVYDKESKERFSLGEKVKELAQLNHKISEEANNLTKALKGEAKTQGRWGEMILENILEKSGLVKDREYFLEHELLDANGKPLKSDSEGKKMRPDVVIKYPDNRNVIIDSKVSLNAFTRLIESTDKDEQKEETDAHVKALRNHINGLSAKGYDDYDRALDFVMMFVPSEAAYTAALQADPDLWNYAYDKRILLLSPTNLITSLKLIVDLWKREYQNKNALEIAERGAKLYDKFVGFVENLDDLGGYLEKAQGKYEQAHKQLCTGNDNLVLQATKLKELGLKTKKKLPNGIVESSSSNNLLQK